MENCLEIKNVSKIYEGFKLNNISLNIPKGCIMGLIGENGAGKSTLMKLVLNLISKNEGTINIFGLDNIKDDKKIKEKIGVVLDESFFYEGLNVSEINKIMSNIYKNWDSNCFFQYLKKFNIPERKNIKEFSRGMKMKLNISVALSHDAKLLILDEAMSGLDPIVRSEVLDVFMDFIQDEERSILISSHITSDLEKVADYITFIHNGKIMVSKSKDEFLEEYGLLKCGVKDIENISPDDIISYRNNGFGCEVLVGNKNKVKLKYPEYVMDNVSLDDIMLFYVRGNMS